MCLLKEYHEPAPTATPRGGGPFFYGIVLLFSIVESEFTDNSLHYRLERSDAEVGLEGHCFHAGPLIRREKNYSMLSRQLRGRIFSRMMAFARKVDYKYHCLSVDKKFITSTEQIVTKLQSALNDFIL